MNDLEKLNKSQIVLLTLLVSFVTSIATGIVTITLMEQAPPAVTQTVNRIVERTVEKVAPAAQVAAATTITEKTVVVREADLIAKAAAKATPSVVRMYVPGKDEEGKDVQLFVGYAVVSNSDGILLADAGTPDGALTIIRFDGTETGGKVLERPSGAKVVRIQAATSTIKNEKPETIQWIPATFSAGIPELGQSVITIAGRSSPRVAEGIITALSGSEAKDMKERTVETDIGVDSFGAGSPLLNLNGEVVGLATRATREIGSAFLASPGIVSYSIKVDIATSSLP